MNLVALGQRVPHPDALCAATLEAVPRALGRRALGGVEAHFTGADVWHAYELSWLDARGRPQVAVGRLCVPADSPCLIESKSLKLFLGGLNFTRFASPQAVVDLLTVELSRAAQAPVSVALQARCEADRSRRPLPGTCIDDAPLDGDLADTAFIPSPELLPLAGPGSALVGETLHSHLLRSICPVTAQPDWGSLVVRYRGPRIGAAALLRYLISFRRHSGFHETLVERIFADLRARCAPRQLTVWAQYTRRGGLDINPFRSSFKAAPTLAPTFRQ